MARIGAVLGAVVMCAGAYASAWSMVWLAGDRSAVLVKRIAPEGGTVRYPGVLFGGLPPYPDSVDSGLLSLALLAAVCALLVPLGLAVASVLRNRRTSLPPQT